MRFFTQVEIEFEVPDEVGEPKHRGDAPIDYAYRAVAQLRPALESLIADAGTPVTGYFIVGPRRCECLAMGDGPAHGDACKAEDPRAAELPAAGLVAVKLEPTCVIEPGMSEEARDDCTLHEHEGGEDRP